MTRINASYPVEELCDSHLLAEHREIKRIPNCIKSGRYNMEGIPRLFTLGKGHVKFFYNKLEYLRIRYESLYTECINRGFSVTYYGDAFNGLPNNLMNNWVSTHGAYKLISERISEKLLVMKSVKYTAYKDTL